MGNRSKFRYLKLPINSDYLAKMLVEIKLS